MHDDYEELSATANDKCTRMNIIVHVYFGFDADHSTMVLVIWFHMMSTINSIGHTSNISIN